jgi:hypothetical protein
MCKANGLDQIFTVLRRDTAVISLGAKCQRLPLSLFATERTGDRIRVICRVRRNLHTGELDALASCNRQWSALSEFGVKKWEVSAEGNWKFLPGPNGKKKTVKFTLVQLCSGDWRSGSCAVNQGTFKSTPLHKNCSTLPTLQNCHLNMYSSTNQLQKKKWS